MARLVKVPGIVIQASGLRAKATRLTLQCRSCRNIISNMAVKPGLEGVSLPRRCSSDQTGRPKCAMDPFFVVPDKCKCVDFQVQPLPSVFSRLLLSYLPSLLFFSFSMLSRVILYLTQNFVKCLAPSKSFPMIQGPCVAGPENTGESRFRSKGGVASSHSAVPGPLPHRLHRPREPHHSHWHLLHQEGRDKTSEGEYIIVEEERERGCS